MKISDQNLSKELPAFQNEIAIKHKLASSSSSSSSNNDMMHSSNTGPGMSDHHSARMMECYPPTLPCQTPLMPTPVNPVSLKSQHKITFDTDKIARLLEN